MSLVYYGLKDTEEYKNAFLCVENMNRYLTKQEKVFGECKTNDVPRFALFKSQCLFDAVVEKKIEVVKYLIRCEPHPYVIPTCISMAILDRNIDILKTLLTVDDNKSDKEKLTIQFDHLAQVIVSGDPDMLCVMREYLKKHNQTYQDAFDTIAERF